MPLDVFNNLGQTVVLTGGTTNSLADNAFVVNTSALFQNIASSAATPPTQFRIQDINAPTEIMIVTNVATTSHGTNNDWTIIRGAENTAPIAHAANWIAQGVVTAGALDSRYAPVGSLAFEQAVALSASPDQMEPMQANLTFSGFKGQNAAVGTLSGDLATIDQLGGGTYGDGSDGVIVLDGVTSVAVCGGSPLISGGIAFYALARDMFASSFTIYGNVVLLTQGYRIFCTGTTTGSNLVYNGPSLVQGPRITCGSFFGYPANTLAAGTGQTAGTTGNGGAGIAVTNAFGGAGGTGGAGSGGRTGGGPGTVTAPALSLGLVRSLPQAVLGLLIGGGSTALANGGAGGGAGGGDGTNPGGAGGRGGGTMMVASRFFVQGLNFLTFSNRAGPNNLSLMDGITPGTGNCGGGAGGGGGLIIVVSDTPTIPSIDNAGGAGAVGIGTGAAGSNGLVGTSVLIKTI